MKVYNRKPLGSSVDKSKGPWHKKQTVYSARVTQVDCDVELCMISPVSPVSVGLACFPVMLVLPGESTVSDLVRLGVASPCALLKV